MKEFIAALFDMYREGFSEERDTEGGEEEVKKLVLKEFAGEDSSHLTTNYHPADEDVNVDDGDDDDDDGEDDVDVDVDPLHLLLPSFTLQAGRGLGNYLL